MRTLRKSSLGLAACALLAMLTGIVARNTAIWQPAMVSACALFAFGMGVVPALRTYQFTAWIIAAVAAAATFPWLFTGLNPDDPTLPRNKWIMLLVIQAVMFGMGTQMSLRDFAGLGRMSYGVLIGLILQFSVMPLVGYSLAKLFGFSPEIAAGMILIGACSSGLASNVMTYIANANLVLSVALTSVGTLLAPIMTPLWMKLLAGDMVPVSFVKMMLEIVKLVIVPIGAALLHDYLKHASTRGRRIVWAAAGVAALWLLFIAVGGWNYLAAHINSTSLTALGMFGFLCGSLLAGVLYHTLTKLLPGLPRFMPLLSMGGIIFFTAVTTAVGRDKLLAIGWLLLIAVMLHNVIGYLLGYWLSRACGLDEKSARTVALEVGIHNGGMASGLASAMGKLSTVGLAAAIFSPWMNISGSLLANYWRRRPTEFEGELTQKPVAP